ncbi:MAG: type II toxin-antitoxin system VapC family toxin [Candidatus Methanoperedens sp.]|nr:type II toxin-antitoxin system VapC family toxin [Candidatus Methanoperedens sp.]
MVKQITIDSSVIVAALLDKEKYHNECRNLLEKVKNGEYIAIEPLIVLVEIVAAIKRRTGSSRLAERVKEDICDINSIVFLDIVSTRAHQAADIAKEIGVRGMDAIVIQTAREFNIPLVSLDREMLERSRSIIDTKNVEEL